MGGLHLIDLLVIVGIGLVLLGPKTLQSLSRNAGKGLSQAKSVKDKVMAELPMEEISQVSQHVPRIPLNSNQAVQMLLKQPKTQPAQKAQPTQPAQKVEEEHQPVQDNIMEQEQ